MNMKPIQPDHTIDEIACWLSISKPKVYDLVHKGHLHAYKVGRATRVTRESVEQFRKSGGAAQ